MLAVRVVLLKVALDLFRGLMVGIMVVEMGQQENVVVIDMAQPEAELPILLPRTDY